MTRAYHSSDNQTVLRAGFHCWCKNCHSALCQPNLVVCCILSTLSHSMRECRQASMCLSVSFGMHVPASDMQGAPVRDAGYAVMPLTLVCALQGEIKVLIWTFYKSLASLPWVSLLIFLVFYVYGGCTADTSRCVAVSGCATIALYPHGRVVGPAVILVSAYTRTRPSSKPHLCSPPTHWGLCR